MSSTRAEALRERLPEAAWPPVQDWIRHHAVEVAVVQPRRTKLGDYRSARYGSAPRITVNNDLNPFAFLVTLVHEFAHHDAWLSHRWALPHGDEWRSAYQRLMRPYLSPAVLPADVLLALDRHLRKAPASSCTDRTLMRALLRHEPEPVLVLERLPERTVFAYNGGHFVKGPRLRTRFKCRSITDNRIYLMDPLISVLVHEPVSIGWAS